MRRRSDRSDRPHVSHEAWQFAFFAGLLLFAASLASPGIVYKPDPRSNPKASDCGFAVRGGVMCNSFSFGRGGSTVCEPVNGPTPGRTFVDKQKILDYCKGWDMAFGAKEYGYSILLLGSWASFSVCLPGLPILLCSWRWCCRHSGRDLLP